MTKPSNQYLDKRVGKLLSDFMNLVEEINFEIAAAQDNNDKELRDMLIGNLALLMRVLQDGENTLPAMLCKDKAETLTELFSDVNKNLIRLDVKVCVDEMKKMSMACDHPDGEHKDDEDEEEDLDMFSSYVDTIIRLDETDDKETLKMTVKSKHDSEKHTAYVHIDSSTGVMTSKDLNSYERSTMVD